MGVKPPFTQVFLESQLHTVGTGSCAWGLSLFVPVSVSAGSVAFVSQPRVTSVECDYLVWMFLVSTVTDTYVKCGYQRLMCIMTKKCECFSLTCE